MEAGGCRRVCQIEMMLGRMSGGLESKRKKKTRKERRVKKEGENKEKVTSA